MSDDWPRHKVIYELKKRGHNALLAIDLSNSLSRGTTSRAITFPSRKGEEVIAGLLDVKPHRIWPSRYWKNGKRKNPQPAANYSCRNGKGKSQKGALK